MCFLHGIINLQSFLFFQYYYRSQVSDWFETKIQTNLKVSGMCCWITRLIDLIHNNYHTTKTIFGKAQRMPATRYSVSGSECVRYAIYRFSTFSPHALSRMSTFLATEAHLRVLFLLVCVFTFNTFCRIKSWVLRVFRGSYNDLVVW